MNAQTQTAEAAPVAPITETPAPVVASGITNKSLKATDEQVATFCKLVIKGLPTGKIFPAAISEMEFTDNQRKAIAKARTDHRKNTRANKAAILKTLKSESILFHSHKLNSTGEKGRLGYVKKSAFDKKTKVGTANAIAKFFGDAPAKADSTVAGGTVAAK